LEARGLLIATVEEAVVTHRQLLDLGRFVRKHYHYGRGSRRYRRRHHLGLERPGFYAGLVQSGFTRGARVGLSICVAQLATAAGYAAASLSRRGR
jgi:hypothetical protein